jgi:hypothetical protein
MPLLEKPIKEISESDLTELVSVSIPEGKSLDYKLALPKQDPSDKREFLADVSALANSSGGMLIFGVREDKGVAVEVPGLQVQDADQELLRLNNILQTGVEPRIPAIETHVILLANGKHVLCIRTPRSWLGPHMVKDSGRFFARNSAGKYPLDVGEIRNAFNESERIVTKLKEFRAARLSAILADEIPATLETTLRIVLHLIPFSGFRETFNVDLHKLLRPDGHILVPIGEYSGYSWSHVFEGLVCHSNPSGGKCSSYTLAMRNGAIEVATSDLMWNDRGSGTISKFYEKYIVDYWPPLKRVCEAIAIEPPFAIGLSLLNTRGCTMAGAVSNWRGQTPIQQQHLIIPECIVENWSANFAGVMKHAFDMVANAQGLSGSNNFDDKGIWRFRH